MDWVHSALGSRMLKQSRTLSELAEFTQERAACHPGIRVVLHFGRNEVAACSRRWSAANAARHREDTTNDRRNSRNIARAGDGRAGENSSFGRPKAGQRNERSRCRGLLIHLDTNGDDVDHASRLATSASVES